MVEGIKEISFDQAELLLSKGYSEFKHKLFLKRVDYVNRKMKRGEVSEMKYYLTSKGFVQLHYNYRGSSNLGTKDADCIITYTTD